MHQFRDTNPIECRNRVNDEVTGGDATKETDFGIDAKARSDEVGDRDSVTATPEP